MLLHRFQGEQGITELKEFYRGLVNTHSYHWIGIEMGHFLERVEQEVASDQAWYFHTSHHLLHLHPNNETEDVVVSLRSTGEETWQRACKIDGVPPEERGRFFIKYRIPTDLAPWPDANVEMEARSVSDALRAFELALAKCDRTLK